MARANRHYLAGQIWHLTHRCHQRQFLLKFARDRQAWIDWLFEARKRFGLCVLDYRATLNHIHLLVYDRQGRDVIPDSRNNWGSGPKGVRFGQLMGDAIGEKVKLLIGPCLRSRRAI